MLKVQVLAAAAAALLLTAVTASAGTYTHIAAYGAPGTSTSILAINNAGYITGAINDSSGAGPAFIRDPLGTYTTFTDAGAFATTGRAINSANTITGYSTDSTQNLVTASEFQRTAGGTVTTLTNPITSAPLNGIAQGINASGTIVGDYFFNSGGHLYRHGYVLNGGTFTDLSVGAAFTVRTLARGITDSGLIVGWTSSPGLIQGFVYSGGSFSLVNDPNAVNGTYLEGVNNNGLAVGEWVDAGSVLHPFVYNLLTTSFTDLTPPTGSNYDSFGINDQGEVVLTNGTDNWLYNPLGVPEPATWALMLIGVGAVGGAARRRHQKA